MSSYLLQLLSPGSWIQDSVLLCEIYQIQGYDEVRFTWTEIGIYVLGAFMVLLAIWQGAVTVASWAKKPSQSSTKLFATLIRSHHLSRQEAKLIEQVARHLPGSIPATALFIDPRLWDDDSFSLPSGEISSLKKKLFGG
ncbi:MAG: hypothetical protein ACK5PB_10850 [Pirellula sp.]|jgi:hypothetical protein